MKIQRIAQHFGKEKTLDHVHKGRSGRRSIITPEKREQVRESVVSSPKKSYRIRAQELAFSPTTLLRIIRKNLKLFPFRILSLHVLQQQNKEVRIKKCDWLNEKKAQANFKPGSITLGLMMEHTFVLMGLLITITMYFGEKRSQDKSVRSALKIRRSLHFWHSMNFCVSVKACFNRNGAHVEHVSSQKFL